MKKIRSLLSLIVFLMIFFGINIYASEMPQDDIFDEVYYNSPGDSLHIMHRFKIIDQDHHVYVIKSGTSFKRMFENSVSGDVYDEISITNGRSICAEITGVLKSSTAKIIDYKEWGLPEAKIAITDQQATCLKPDMDTMVFSSVDVNAKDESFIIEKRDDINVFTASGSEISCPSGEVSIFLYQLTVQDQGIDTVCTFIMGDFYDYLYYNNLGKWDRNKGTSDWSSYLENITLYDGTDGRVDLLPEQYQYGKKLNWQSGDMIYGLDKTGLLPEEDIEIPSSIKSIRVSYEDQFPEPHSALYLQMPGNHINAQIIDPIQQIHDYYFYRNKTHMVSIDGDCWYEIKGGQASPELQLKKGLNFVYIIDSDLKRRSSGFDGNNDARDILYHLLVLYWDGEEDYSVSPNQSTELENLQIFRAGFDESDSLEGFVSYDISEEKSGEETVRTIDMNSAYPYLWINPITEAAEATVIIEGSKPYLGGYFLRCDSEKDYFDIKVESENGKSEKKYRIHINWTLAAPELKDLSILTGGSLDEDFSPEIKSYYCQKGSLGKIALSYTTSDNVTTKVSVDREQKAVVEGRKQKTLMVDATAHEIRWDIESPVGKNAVYTMYLDRGKEKGLSENTRQRAKSMIEKLLSGSYDSYLKQYNGDSYWKTFGAASLGEEYLEGMLAYDVTQHEYKQSSDYAAVILELIMSGENPYDFLGTNYVEKLWEYNENGNFGPFSCNIWALTALEACGHSIPDKLLDYVKVIALSEGADLDMRGWALYALAPYRSYFTEKEYAKCIQSIKNVQIYSPIAVNGIDVTGCFENFWYTNRNANTHACVVSGLIGMGIDIAAQEFCGENGADPISVLENYQAENGGWIFTPNNPTATGSYNKDVIVAVGDIYHGTNVYTRYYLTENRYKEILNQARELLENDISDGEKKEHLKDAYEEAVKYASDGNNISNHGMEYYALQDAIYAIVPDEKPDVFMGTVEERQKVKEVNDLIKTISSFSYSDKDNLERIKEKYQNLNKERLFHYVVDKDILDKAYSYIRDIDAFLEAIDKIGTVNLTKTSKIKKARKAYDALSDRQKEEDVVNEAYKTLQEAEAAIIKMNDPDKVERAIRNLGSIVTLDLQDDIEAVREAYDSLSDADKAKVTNVEDLEKAEEKLRDLLARETAIDNAAAVTEKIASIGDVSRNSEDAIRQAREAYDALETEEEKNLVSNYRILLDSETEYANLLDREELGNALSEADYHINQIYQAFGDSDQLGEDNCQDVSEAVEEAGRFFEQKEEKWPDFCQMVSGYPSYVDIRTMIAEYTFDPDLDASLDNLEGILDSIGDVTLDREPDVRKAEMILETLRASDGTSDDLGAYETRISSLGEEITAIRDSYPDICSLVTAIESVGEVSQTYQDAYLEAANLYNNAEEALISRIPATAIETITEAGNKYGELREEIEEISRIEGQIEETRQASSLLDEEAVVSARDAYEGSGRKESISNYLTLLEAEKKIVSLKKAAEDAQIAAEVEDMIGLLNSGSGIDPADVALARVAYDALTDAQKGMVSNYADLELAEEKAGNIPSPPDDDPEGPETPAKKTVYTISLIRNKKASNPYLVGKKTRYRLVLKADGKAVAASKVKWKSGKKVIASISKNTVTFKKKGTVKITAVYSGKKHSFTLKVKKASFELKKKKVALKAGKRYQIRYTALPEGKVIYKSMDKKIASVTKKGVIKARKKGRVKIRVKANGIIRYLKVKVR